MIGMPFIKTLVPMDLFTGSEPLKTDLVYARSEHPENIFGITAYEPHARMILHEDLARIVILAARLLRQRHGWTIVLKDGLRPVEAQARLINTHIVRQNPHWLEEPGRLLSSPGQGAHPRGMAIDVSAVHPDESPVDMGTVFDTMVPASARNHTDLPPAILEDRWRLEQGFVDAAQALSLPILPLPSEWWDFRFPADHYKGFPALSDADLPPPLKMCTPHKPDADWDSHFEQLAKSILLSLQGTS